MPSLSESIPYDEEQREDHFVHLHGATWADYQRLLEIRGEYSRPRIAYLEGTLEIMSPSSSHEWIKSIIAHLVAVWCLERGIEFSACGSWTLKRKKTERGVEPNECYIFGPRDSRKRPELAIEVIWTDGGLNKLEIYRKLGVPEVWLWRDGRIHVHRLRARRYENIAHSELVPDIDLEQLVTFIDRPTTSRAILDYQAALRGSG
jgi:Uma2 family endonuclease